MPQLTITAVTPASSTLTIPAHGLVTGAGAAAVYTPNGTIPGSLAAVTDYWVIVVDVNTVKLATSSTNALAGTAITITTAGSGTLLLLVGIPYRRRTTYAAGSQIKSLDLDELQDALTAIWNALTGQVQAVFSDLMLAANRSIVLQGTGSFKRGPRTRHLPGCDAAMVATPAAGTTYYSGSAAQFRTIGNLFELALPADQGERITSVVAYVACGGTDTITVKMFKLAATVGGVPAPVQIGATATSTGHSSGVELLTIAGLTELADSTTTHYYLEIACTAFGTNPYFYGVAYILDIP